MNSTQRVAIVTGAAQGIGEAIALRLEQAAANVVVVDLNLTLAETVAARLRTRGRRSLAIHCDVSQASQVSEMVGRVLHEMGRVDVLVNNAGIAGKNAPLADVTEEDWERVMAVDLKSVFLCSKAVLPYMMEQHYGKIVNVASIAGKEGNPNLVPYSTAKAGLAMLGAVEAADLILLRRDKAHDQVEDLDDDQASAESQHRRSHERTGAHAGHEA